MGKGEKSGGEVVGKGREKGEDRFCGVVGEKKARERERLWERR